MPAFSAICRAFAWVGIWPFPTSPLVAPMNDLEFFSLDECTSCSMALDSHAEEGLCYRCASALHDVSMAIEAFPHELTLLALDEDATWIM
jgi:hypothetical protein